MMHFFQLVVPESAPWWVGLLAIIFPIASGWLSTLVMDGVKQLVAKLDTASVVVKQIVSVLIALGVSWLAAKFGATIDPDLHSWTAAGLNALFTVLAQQGLYKWKSDNVAAKQGIATLSQQRNGLTVPAPRH